MSLNHRIILSATLVLVVFITLTALTLERAFVDSSESSLRDTLTSQLYALMAVAEVENNTLTMPSNELDALLGLPSSGIYAYITNKTGRVLWQSSSTLGATPPQPRTLAGGDKRFDKISVKNDTYYAFAYGVDWASDTSTISLTFNLATDLKSFNKQISLYRKTLWSWLIGMAILLLLSQALILRWGLSPLRKVGVELNSIESGEQEQIQQHYPQEIERLTNNINVLLQQERDQKTRYRNALGDLAHSLKTPLAVLQTSLNSNNQDNTLLEQVTQMNSIVEYQLQRAATAG
ncbi:MAG: two-component sensor histidine kinase, partial [Gammaproteobacteria bacterium]